MPHASARFILSNYTKETRLGGGGLFEEPRDDEKNGERWINKISQTSENTKSHLIGSATSTSLAVLDSRGAVSLPQFPSLPSQGLGMGVLK